MTMAEWKYTVSFLSNGRRVYRASPDMNDTTENRSEAYKVTKDLAEKAVRSYKRAGYLSVRYGS